LINNIVIDNRANLIAFFRQSLESNNRYIEVAGEAFKYSTTYDTMIDEIRFFKEKLCLLEEEKLCLLEEKEVQ
jgi:hypothetical protein